MLEPENAQPDPLLARRPAPVEALRLGALTTGYWCSVQSCRERLRPLVEDADATLGTTQDVTQTWQRLQRGELVVVDTFCSATRHFVILTGAGATKPISPTGCELLQLVLASDSQKRTAHERGIPQSTLSLRAQRALQDMGTSFVPSKVPLSLALLIGAFQRERPLARLCCLATEAKMYWVVSIPRPELLLATKLTSSEFDVLCRLLQGYTYRQIAEERGTSERTVANQVATAFRRLRVSGRAQLIALLLTTTDLDNELNARRARGFRRRPFGSAATRF